MRELEQSKRFGPHWVTTVVWRCDACEGCGIGSEGDWEEALPAWAEHFNEHGEIFAGYCPDWQRRYEVEDVARLVNDAPQLSPAEFRALERELMEEPAEGAWRDVLWRCVPPSGCIELA